MLQLWVLMCRFAWGDSLGNLQSWEFGMSGNDLDVNGYHNDLMGRLMTSPGATPFSAQKNMFEGCDQKLLRERYSLAQDQDTKRTVDPLFQLAVCRSPQPHNLTTRRFGHASSTRSRHAGCTRSRSPTSFSSGPSTVLEYRLTWDSCCSTLTMMRPCCCPVGRTAICSCRDWG